MINFLRLLTRVNNPSLHRKCIVIVISALWHYPPPSPLSPLPPRRGEREGWSRLFASIIYICLSKLQGLLNLVSSLFFTQIRSPQSALQDEREGRGSHTVINRFKIQKFWPLMKDVKGTDRLCKIVKLSMQCCGKILKDSIEAYTTFSRSVNPEFERKVDVQNRIFGWIRFQNVFLSLNNDDKKCKQNSTVN